MCQADRPTGLGWLDGIRVERKVASEVPIFTNLNFYNPTMDNKKSLGSELFFPDEGTFFNLVDEADSEDAQKEEAREEDGDVFLNKFAVDEDPGHEEDYLYIKKDEEHGHEVELNGEAGVIFASGREAALIGHILDGVGARLLAKKMTNGQDCPSQKDGDEDLDQYGKVGFQSHNWQIIAYLKGKFNRKLCEQE